MGLRLITALSLICLWSPVLGEADSAGLFSTSDAVVHLDSSNFQRAVTGTDHAWFVDFYSVWCGHCVRFAPIYKAFGRDIEDWYKVMRVGAIACSSPGNSPTCRRYDIWGYPTVKFFPPKSAESHKGTSFNGDRNVENLRKKALDYLTDWLKTNPAPTSWPQLTPHRSVAAFVASCGRAHYRFLLADSDKYLGKEVILDFSYAHPATCVGQIERSDARRAGITSFPSLYLITASGKTHRIHINGSGRKAISTAIRSMVKGHYDPGVSSPQGTQKTPTGTQKYRPPDGVHSFDLESAIYYSLWLEIGTHQIIDGERLSVLKHYIDILSRYYPGNELVHNFLNKTNTWIKGMSSSLVGQQWLNKISNLQEPGRAFVLNKERWTACRGSQPRYRGYPCSMWTLFHAITVNAEQIEQHNSMFNPKEIPVLMNDYIQQFFGCRECATNFGKGARRINNDVTRRTDAILWLWKSHNRANHWLHNDPTEDPEQAKIQFPSYKACALCRRARSYGLFDNATVWDEDQVLQYLTHFYAKPFIKKDSKGSRNSCDIWARTFLGLLVAVAVGVSRNGHVL